MRLAAEANSHSALSIASIEFVVANVSATGQIACRPSSLWRVRPIEAAVEAVVEAVVEADSLVGNNPIVVHRLTAFGLD